MSDPQFVWQARPPASNRTHVGLVVGGEEVFFHRLALELVRHPHGDAEGMLRSVHLAEGGKVRRFVVADDSKARKAPANLLRERGERLRRRNRVAPGLARARRTLAARDALHGDELLGRVDEQPLLGGGVLDRHRDAGGVRRIAEIPPDLAPVGPRLAGPEEDLGDHIALLVIDDLARREVLLAAGFGPVGQAEAEDVWAEAATGARPAIMANATEVKEWRRMTVFLGWATFGDGPSPG